jgi:torulene dioxygenase
MLTDNYVLLCIFDAYLAKGGIKMLWTRNILDALEYFPDRTNKWLVIDRRHGKGLVGIYESDPFFAFHPINA